MFADGHPLQRVGKATQDLSSRSSGARLEVEPLKIQILGLPSGADSMGPALGIFTSLPGALIWSRGSPPENAGAQAVLGPIKS